RFWPLTALLPRTFQARLTMGFVGIVALTLILVSAFVIKSLDDYFSTQELVDLRVRADTVRAWVVAVADTASGDRPVVKPDNVVDSTSVTALAAPANIRFLADRLAQANVQIRLGSLTRLPD